MMTSNDDGRSKSGHISRIPGDYEVGYGQPPREHQFKKGEASRNPKGRPRGANRAAPDLVGVLLQSTTIRIQGKERKVPDLEAMILVMKDKTLRGDHRAAQMVIDLMRELNLIRPKQAFNPPSVTIVFKTPGDKNTSKKGHTRPTGLAASIASLDAEGTTFKRGQWRCSSRLKVFGSLFLSYGINKKQVRLGHVSSTLQT